MKIVKSSKLLTVACALALGSVGSVYADHEGVNHGKGKGPQFSVDVSAYCGNPDDIVYDTDGYTVLHTFDDDNLVIFLSNESDDSGPIKDEVAMLEIQCYEKVGKGRNGYDELGDKITREPADFGKLVRNCPAESGTEIKATVTVKDTALKKNVSDTCEEVILY
jgi:hypothetical protein